MGDARAPHVPTRDVLDRVWDFLFDLDGADCSCECPHDEDEDCDDECEQCIWCQASDLMVLWTRNPATCAHAFVSSGEPPLGTPCHRGCGATWPLPDGTRLVKLPAADEDDR